MTTRKPYQSALDVAMAAPEGTPWSLTAEWGEQLVSDYQLDMQQAPHNLTGNTSALFEVAGVQLRLEHDWMGRYTLFKGAWKRDPRWTGD